MERIFITFFLLLCFASSRIVAQNTLLETISIEQGLSQGFVPSMCQDEDGFLWFATKNGLNRYDGYEFKVFRHSPNDSLSLSQNEVFFVTAAGEFLVLITLAEDIVLFHRKTQRFYTVPNLSHAPWGALKEVTAEGNNAVRIVGWLDNTININRLEWPANLMEQIDSGIPIQQLVRIEKLPIPPQVLAVGQIPGANKYCLLSTRGVYLYDIASGATEMLEFPFQLPPLLPRAQMNNYNFHLMSIFPESSRQIWIYWGSWMIQYDGQHWQQYTLPVKADGLLFADAQNGILWVTSNVQLFGLDYKRVPFNPEPVWRLNTGQAAISGLVDHTGNVWLGTDARGLRKFSPKARFFKNYLEEISVLCHPAINKNGQVMLTDLRRGYVGQQLLDTKTRQSKTFQELGFKNTNPGVGITYSTTDSSGNFWVLQLDKIGYLKQYNPVTGQIQAFPLPFDYFSPTGILKFVAPNAIWIIDNNQLLRFDLNKHQFTTFKVPAQNSSYVFAADIAPDGTWWIGTNKEGVICAKPDGKGAFDFSTFKTEKGKQNSLTSNDIKSILVDPDDPSLIWIGTNGFGLNCFDQKTGHFKQYNTSNGMPDETVYGILADNETPRNIWLSTNRGLARLSPETGRFQYFTKADGLPDNEFNTHAAVKSPDGKLCFGTVNGLTIFEPKKLLVSTQAPPVRFSGLKINGQTINPRDSTLYLEKDIAFLELLELPHDHNNLLLQFAAMDFTYPARNQFAYYLEGAESPWIHQGSDHTAQYLNLSPGAYTFHVKAANDNGAWNDAHISLKIIIHPPWYRSVYAYAFYLLAIMGAAYMFYKNQLRRRLEQVESERLKGLDEFKTRFFTNITHEFRTPLTVILGMAEKLQAETNRQAKTLIIRSGENLLRLINQILDLAKLENNSLKLNYIQGDVLAYLRYILESLHSLAQAQDVTLSIKCAHTSILMDYDPERLLQIIHNLLSNAIKFTPADGEVMLKVDVLENSSGYFSSNAPKVFAKQLQIQVIDTGVGIQSEALPFLFDRFFQAKNQSQNKAGGTGIGLSLTRELVRSMGGEISVESEPGNGAVFTVLLPMHNNAVLENGISRSASPISASLSAQPVLESLQAPGKVADQTQVLLIEDNPDVVEYLANCLQHEYGLSFAFNGRSGIEKALEQIPDLIISDVMMPEKDGYEVCDALKNDERSSHIPIILLTAKASVEDRITGLKRGADAYLAKPFQEEELLTWVEQLIQRRRLLQERYTSMALGQLNVSSRPSTETEAGSPIDVMLEDTFIRKLQVILEKRYTDSSFSVDALSADIAMSRTQIHRKLKALTNRSTTEYINLYRLEKAREILLKGEMNISEVAYEVGFNDPKYFSRVFTDVFGYAPSEERRKLQ